MLTVILASFLLPIVVPIGWVAIKFAFAIKKKKKPAANKTLLLK
jgi:hypothetical protein